MNVYDFDKTIYSGDSSIDFFLFTLKHQPAVLRCIPKQLIGFMLYGMRLFGKTELKEFFFCFLSAIQGEKLVQLFWDQNASKIGKWYLQQQEPDDIIISASPDFLLRPLCQRIGVRHLIASRVDIRTGKFSGRNCRGAEKVRRLSEEFNVTQIDRFYSDSLTDLPLAKIAGQAFLVKNGLPTEWKTP